MSRREGSSPLARGTRGRPPDTRALRGLIPARAGNTSATPPLTACRRAHPRSRGEHPRLWHLQRQPTGSSPLARGTQTGARNIAIKLGLIPARAGNTPQPRYAPLQARAHPRSRGEHDYAAFSGVPAGGSSPLARGTHAVNLETRICSGLIPARAGNTRRDDQKKKSIRAHPRSRGEHTCHGISLLCASGSSPLARGTRGALPAPHTDQGLIPARAGNTMPEMMMSGIIGAHPRSRGEHPGVDEAVFEHEGSSPLARGTRVEPAGDGDDAGLIPARAGNTTPLRLIMASWGAHPRSRGEHPV